MRLDRTAVDRDQRSAACLGIEPSLCVYCCNPRSLPPLLDYSNNFTFDRVFGMESTQDEVFDFAAKPVVEDCLKGYNWCVPCVDGLLGCCYCCGNCCFQLRIVVVVVYLACGPVSARCSCTVKRAVVRHTA